MVEEQGWLRDGDAKHTIKSMSSLLLLFTFEGFLSAGGKLILVVS